MATKQNKELNDVKNFVEQVPSDIIVRNLSLWLRLALDKGIALDVAAANTSSDAVPASDKDSE